MNGTPRRGSRTTRAGRRPGNGAQAHAERGHSRRSPPIRELGLEALASSRIREVICQAGNMHPTPTQAAASRSRAKLERERRGVPRLYTYSPTLVGKENIHQMRPRPENFQKWSFSMRVVRARFFSHTKWATLLDPNDPFCGLSRFRGSVT